MPSPSIRKGVIFDLDGVVTDSARVHAQAWKEMFDEFLSGRTVGEASIPDRFDLQKDYVTYLDGKPRYDGVESFLRSRSIVLEAGHQTDGTDRLTVCGLGNRKDRYFNRILDEQGVEVFESTLTFIHDLAGYGVAIGVASSSKNCMKILRRMKLDGLFEAHVDGEDSFRLGLKGKPAPDIFLTCAQHLGVGPKCAAVIEDAISGVQAGRAGKFGLVVGIDRGTVRDALLANGADVVVRDLAELSAKRVVEMLEA